ncbi:MAG: hypothetical protein A3K19_31430 [Lentisphaerae bacterium RIFOXYB12_FULL_65_16]|nr:MAG: hypothetical protein A3K18_34470 [Lentisphaerae bacterium RIFOXYA12_64_32]OGV88558.1 MAG: hypothetical protein A3K19_31430 [Lentisphaerae bacterium RIFOXYB12_FULL_65_16]
MKTELRIVFQPSGRTVHVLAGTKIFEAAARAGLLLQNPCGGKGTCGKCRVRIVKGACEPTEACRKLLGDEKTRDGYRLACQAAITEECVVEVPFASLYDSRTQILTSAEGKCLGGKPAVWKKYVELPPPTTHDALADLKRLERVIGRFHVNLNIMHDLPVTLRQDNFTGTAVVCASQLLAFERGNTEADCYAVAFDLGTTTVVGALLDLAQGREIAVAATMNPQISYGDDVISRITRAREDAHNVAKLQRAVVQTFNDLISDLVTQTGIDRHHIYEVAVAGNTTMQHFFCGINPSALGEVPFPPAYVRALLLDAREVALDLHPNAKLYVFPNIGGFVGGDTVAGVLANSLLDAKQPTLFIDIGTNGEIVLANRGKLSAASTAAGPAFEGARITAGMRATTGAIEKIVVENGDIACNVIGNAPPVGLCGTALIDVAAELLRLGVIDTTGRVVAPDELPATTPDAIRARIHDHNGQMDFLIAAASESGTGEPVYLCQRDVRELQLATGAIRAGANIMLRKAGLAPEDLHEVLLAGAFGNFIRRRNARRIGLLPALPTEKIRFVGNAACMGAKVVLLSAEQRDVAEKIAETTEHVDLSLAPDFQEEFSMAMLFPESE